MTRRSTTLLVLTVLAAVTSVHTRDTKPNNKFDQLQKSISTVLVQADIGKSLVAPGLDLDALGEAVNTNGLKKDSAIEAVQSITDDLIANKPEPNTDLTLENAAAVMQNKIKDNSEAIIKNKRADTVEADTVDAVVKSAANKLSDARDVISDKFNAAAKSISDAVDANGEAITQPMSAKEYDRTVDGSDDGEQKSLIEHAGDAISDTADKAKSVAQSAAEKTGKFVADTAEKAKSAVVGARDSAVDAKDSAVDVKDNVAESVKQSKDVLVEKANSAKDTLADKAKSAKDTIVDKAKSVKDDVADKAYAAKDAVAAKAAAGKDAVYDVAINVRDSAEEQAGDVSNAISERLSAANEVVDAKLTEVKDKFSGLLSPDNSVIEAADEEAANNRDAVVGAVVGAKDAAAAKLSKAKDAVVGAMSDTADKAGEVVDSAKQAVNEAFAFDMDKVKQSDLDKLPAWADPILDQCTVVTGSDCSNCPEKFGRYCLPFGNFARCCDNMSMQEETAKKPAAAKVSEQKRADAAVEVEEKFNTAPEFPQPAVPQQQAQNDQAEVQHAADVFDNAAEQILKKAPAQQQPQRPANPIQQVHINDASLDHLQDINSLVDDPVHDGAQHDDMDHSDMFGRGDATQSQQQAPVWRRVTNTAQRATGSSLFIGLAVVAFVLYVVYRIQRIIRPPEKYDARNAEADKRNKAVSRSTLVMIDKQSDDESDAIDGDDSDTINGSYQRHASKYQHEGNRGMNLKSNASKLH